MNSTTRYAFTEYPEDWRDRTVEVWYNGMVTLDSGLFSKERKERGLAPSHTLVITERTNGWNILHWIESVNT